MGSREPVDLNSQYCPYQSSPVSLDILPVVSLFWRTLHGLSPANAPAKPPLRSRTLITPAAPNVAAAAHTPGQNAYTAPRHSPHTSSARRRCFTVPHRTLDKMAWLAADRHPTTPPSRPLQPHDRDHVCQCRRHTGVGWSSGTVLTGVASRIAGDHNRQGPLGG